MGLYNDLTSGSKVSAIIPAGTYNSGNNPVSQVLNMEGYPDGVLFMVIAGAVTNAQSFSLQVSNTVTAVPAVQSSLTTLLTGTNNDLKFSAVPIGVLGMGINITYVDPSDVSQSLGITVTGRAIRISLATDDTGTITTIASDISALILATPAAHALVTVANATGNNGTGVVTALTKTPLASGANATYALVSPYTLVSGTDDFAMIPHGALATLGVATTQANAAYNICQYRGNYQYVQLVSTGAGITGAVYAVYAYQASLLSINGF